MNVILDTPARGFVGNEAIGDDVRVSVAMSDPRCVMPSLAQADLPRDSAVLKALGHNRIDVAGALYPARMSTPSSTRRAQFTGLIASA